MESGAAIVQPYKVRAENNHWLFVYRIILRCYLK